MPFKKHLSLSFFGIIAAMMGSRLASTNRRFDLPFLEKNKKPFLSTS